MRIDVTKFAGREDLFRYLIERQTEIIELKKSVEKHSDGLSNLNFTDETNKALSTNHKDDLSTGKIKRSIIANTCNWMDSHFDVHLNGTFKRSISQKPADKIFHLADHDFKITSKIGKFTEVREQKIQWSNLGIAKFGYTEALIADSEIHEDMYPRMFKAYLSNEVDQHSVGMMYVDVVLAMNDPENKAEFANWNEYFPMLGNPEKANELGFFWGVKEAKLKEISAVLEGSNSLTPTIENKIDSTAVNQKGDSSTDTHFQAHKNTILHYY